MILKLLECFEVSEFSNSEIEIVEIEIVEISKLFVRVLKFNLSVFGEF